MDSSDLLDLLGDSRAAALLGLLTGLVFGIAAQRSAFCLRAATVEFARGRLGPRVTVWLLCFSTALAWVQLASLAGLFRGADARIMSVPGSLSGAVIGGTLFGIGMVMARGCSGRLLVLAATGNLRSLVSGLVFAVVAQMSLHGRLAPLRNWLAAQWTTGARNIDALAWAGLPHWAGLALGLGTAGVALALARRNRVGLRVLVFGSGVGFAVALGWVATWQLSQRAFDPVSVTSLTFSGPSAGTLMFFLDRQGVPSFDIGLVPGVFLGAFAAAALAGELEFQGFAGESQMRRSMAGAALMGFGAMLAGGCAIGNGVTGASVFALTSLVALCAMWAGAVATDLLLDHGAEPAAGVA
ncbi:YeeE/YedE family protein [Mangrovicoccus sp. HB161399]|uniref:YeeE/YedE family protein n=1 Tax=Mangrovicoccus sp. HB161399 TaxID=2720392 RepID=UPI00155487A4|nr:YeeE/YedE family protein [Mangrovicoccus sp. HB161399]